jgi:hypothetical protein
MGVTGGADVVYSEPMTTTLFTTIYGAVMHLMAVAALVVLMATSHLDTTTGFPLLAGLLGFAAGVPVTPTATSSLKNSPPTP